MDFSDGPGTPGDEAPSAPRRRGRPRSQETIARDAQVLKALGEGPKTKEQLVDELGLAPQLVYLSLWRLKRDQRVEKTSDGVARHTWSVVA
jgi:predicted Rossmann fold nucleotide-binding protein DprA/Smf involved in DNA uptake